MCTDNLLDISAEFQTEKPVQPDCYKHFIPRCTTSTLDQVKTSCRLRDCSYIVFLSLCYSVLIFSLIQAAVAPQLGEEGMKLKAVIGYNGNGRGNMVWSPEQG